MGQSSGRIKSEGGLPPRPWPKDGLLRRISMVKGWGEIECQGSKRGRELWASHVQLTKRIWEHGQQVELIVSLELPGRVQLRDR